jgi:hypothetical protein
LGRPGVFFAPAPNLARLEAVRQDVAGFVGVALRGPVDTPVLVTRWTEYEQRFGGFERSPGAPERLLPHAVSAFFSQGGERAYVVRVAPHPAAADAAADPTALFALALPGVDDLDQPLLSAADEGTWGNDLVVGLSYDVGQRIRTQLTGPQTLRLPAGASLPAGSLVRLLGAWLPATGLLRWVSSVDGRPPRGAGRSALLDQPVAELTDIDVEVITATLRVDDRSAPNRAGERLTALGLRAEHRRFLGTVLAEESRLVRTVGTWSDVRLTPPSALSPVPARLVTPGRDRSSLIDFDAFFDPGAAGDESPDDEGAKVGVDRIGREPDIGLLCVPDLTWRADTSPPEPRAVPTWVPRMTCCSACDPVETELDYDLPPPVPTGLDPRDPGDLAEIVRRQRRLVDVAVLRRRFVALLDVPDGLSARDITDWRASFDSSYSAAYHPWLATTQGAGAVAVAVPPSAFAAGIIAQRERRLGLPWGPANELARDAVRAESLVTDEIHDQLHRLGINVFREERDGFRLTAGRTLSSDPEYRQLSVRRLMTMIRLALERQTQWLAFEPNTAELRDRLDHVLTSFLRTLNLQGAFAGASEAESFFVSCGDDLNPPSSLALGRLVGEIGVAPSSPLEYLMVRIARDVDGSLEVVGDEG